MSLVSITTVASFDAVGAIMVVAMLITPAASAYLWTDRLIDHACIKRIVWRSFCSYRLLSAAWIDTSISGSMAFATGIFFLISFLCSPKHGLIAKYVKPVKA